MEPGFKLKCGSVVQLNENTGNPLFRGALMMVETPKNFGAQGFVNCLDKGNAYYRARWEDMEYIGEAPLIPKLEADMEG